MVNLINQTEIIHEKQRKEFESYIKWLNKMLKIHEFLSVAS